MKKLLAVLLLIPAIAFGSLNVYPPPAKGGITTLTGDVTASGTGSVAATIAANAVTNAKLSQVGAYTLKGNNTGSTANAADLTLAQVLVMLNPVENVIANSGSSLTVNFTTSPAQGINLTANCTISLTNSRGGQAYVLRLVQDATGSRTVTWPVTVYWPGGSPPTLTTTPFAVDLINLYFDGAYFYGSSALDY